MRPTKLEKFLGLCISLGGLMLLFTIGWKIAVGAFLLVWGSRWEDKGMWISEDADYGSHDERINL